MVSLGNFRSVSQVIPWKQLHYCWDHFRGPKRIPQQRPQQKELRYGSRIAVRRFHLILRFLCVIPNEVLAAPELLAKVGGTSHMQYEERLA